MCNLYTVRQSAAEVAAHFRVPNPMASNAPEEVYPGTPGMVVTETKACENCGRWCGAFRCVSRP
jgi:putative SOS response-associated peptidase YedK